MVNMEKQTRGDSIFGRKYVHKRNPRYLQKAPVR